MPEPIALAPIVLESDKPQGDQAPEPSLEQLLVDDDLVIEEISIDGMCGVY